MRVVLLAVSLILAACTPAPQTGDAADVRIETPEPGARLVSPLQAEGVADNSWYFEAVFPARLVAEDGAVIAEAPAIAHSDWTVPGPVRFNVEMAFSVESETPATLVLSEDMPRDGASERAVRIPVVLLPD